MGYIIIGIVAGCISDKLMGEAGFGFFDHLLVGFVGGVLGGWAFGLLGISGIGSLVGSVIGAALPLWGLAGISHILTH